jgi:hypothetical protein
VSQGEGKAGDSEAELKKLDFSNCQFPSDRLTIGMMRFRHPDLFDHGFDVGDGREQPKYFKEPVGNVEEEIGEMLFCERCVAMFAYAKARGIKPPWALDLEIHKDQLVDIYREWGLADGIAQASELVRDVERRGQQLALKMGRPSRGGR